MKTQIKTKRMSSFTISCLFIASATLTVAGIRIENTGLLIIGIIALFASLYTEYAIISLELSEVLKQKNQKFLVYNGTEVKKTGNATIEIGLQTNNSNAA